MMSGTIPGTTVPTFSTLSVPMSLSSASSNPPASCSENQCTTLLLLPPELLIQVLLHLTPHPASLRSCKLTCRYLHTLIHASRYLVYHAALHATQQDDNPATQMSIKEKMDWLAESSHRWAVLALDPALRTEPFTEEELPVEAEKTKRVKVLKLGHIPSGIYDLTGGVYLLGDLARKALYWVKLPGRNDVLDERKGDEELKWNKIDLDVLRKRTDSDGRERKIVDMGLCVYEHDLIAIVTVSPRPTANNHPPTTNDIDLLLLQFSTGLPHPLLAKGQSYIKHIRTSPTEWSRPAIGIEIVGDNLVLILYYPNAHLWMPEDQVYIWDWKTGVLKLNFTVPNRTYSGLIFLTPQLILLPNTQTNSLDVFRIPAEPTANPRAHEPIVSLGLPPLADGRDLGGVSCRSEPNPVGDPSSSSIPSTRYDKEKDSDRGLCVNTSITVDLNNHSEPPDITPSRPFLPSPESAICIFSMRVLGGPMIQGNQFGHAFTFVVHRNSLVDVVKLWMPNSHAEADDKDDSFMPGAFTSSLPSRIPFTSWGPPITRWFNSDSIPNRWITTTSGQRCVLTADSAPSSGFPYVVLDFGKDSVQRIGDAILQEKERERLEARKRLKRLRKERQERRARREKERMQRAEKERARAERARTNAFASGSESSFVTGTSALGFSAARERKVKMGLERVLETETEMGSETEMEEEMQVMNIDWDQVIVLGSESSAPSESTNGIATTQEQQFDTEMDLDFDIHSSYASDEESEVDEDEDEAFSLSSRTPSPSPSIGSSLEPSAPASLSSVSSATPTPPLPFDRLWCVTSSEMVQPSEAFAEPVEGALPYVACASPQKYAFDGVLLDEERVIGIMTDVADRIKHIEVHYFG